MKRKLLSLALALAMALSLLPAGAMAVEAPEGTECNLSGSAVEVLTGTSSNAATVAGQETMDVTVTPSAALNWFPAQDASVGGTARAAGWWVGIKVLAPQGLVLESATYRNNGDSANKSFKDVRDSGDGDSQQYITLWGAYLEDFMTAYPNQTKFTYKWYFNWDGNESTGKTETVNNTEMKGVDQVVSMTFDLTGVKLMKDGVQVWPESGSTLPEGMTLQNGVLTLSKDVQLTGKTLRFYTAMRGIGGQRICHGSCGVGQQQYLRGPSGSGFRHPRQARPSHSRQAL